MATQDTIAESAKRVGLVHGYPEHKAYYAKVNGTSIEEIDDQDRFCQAVYTMKKSEDDNTVVVAGRWTKTSTGYEAGSFANQTADAEKGTKKTTTKPDETPVYVEHPSAAASAVNAEAAEKAAAYEYDDYTAKGTMTVTSSLDGTTVDYTAGEGAEAKDTMNDFARFLGGLYRQDNGKTVSSIVYGDNTYTWDAEGTLKGSNWKSGETTLVKAVTTDVTADNLTSITLKLNGTEPMVFNF